MFNIVLVEPRMPQNVGNIGRTCVATGSSLHIVHPIPFQITDKNVKRAGLRWQTCFSSGKEKLWRKL